MIRRFASAVVLALLQSAAFADGHAVGIKAGALGLGVEYTHELNERFAVRAGINGSQIGFDGEESGIDYDISVVWDSFSVAVDLHPMKTALRVTAGILGNDNGLQIESRPTTNVTIGDTSYTPTQVGTLTGLVGFGDSAPFLGVGWDWSRGKRFGMSLDLGVLDQGSPRVDLSATGTLLGDPAFQADIATEEAELTDSFGDLDVVPYLTLGFVFRF